MPALNAPAVSHQLQLGFWDGAQAGEKQVAGLKRLAVTGTDGRDFNDQDGADPGIADVRWSLYGAQHPGDIATVALLAISFYAKDMPLSMKLATDLAVYRRPIAFHSDREGGPLLMKLPKKRPLGMQYIRLDQYTLEIQFAEVPT